MLRLAPLALLLALTTCPAQTPPVTSPVTPPVQAPATITVFIQVNGGGAGVGGATADVLAANGPAVWVRCATDATGRCSVTVPASLTDSHLQVSADGWQPLSQHIDVLPNATIAVSLTRSHQPWPDVSQWVPFACDITGVRAPEILQWGTTPAVSSWIVPLYPQATRARIYAAMRERGYRHIVLDPRPKYGTWYPSGVLSVEDFRAALHEALDAGLMPVVVWIPDTIEPTDPSEWDRVIGPYLEDPEIRALAKLSAVAWEINQWADTDDAIRMIRWLRARLAPDARLFLHMTPEHAALCSGEGYEAQFWASMAAENLLDGIFVQLDPAHTIEEQVSRVTDFTERLVIGGHPPWPTRRADGRPLIVVPFEYDAYRQTRQTMTEDDGRARGARLAAIPGASGFCDGGIR